MGIKVRAKGADHGKMVGYYDHQKRKSGEEFEIKDDAAFSEKWMEKVDGPSEHRPTVDPTAPYKPNVGERKPNPDPTALHVPKGETRTTRHDR